MRKQIVVGSFLLMSIISYILHIEPLAFFLLGVNVTILINLIYSNKRKKMEKKKFVGKLNALDHAKIAEFVERKEYQEAVIYMLMRAYNLSREEILNMAPDQIKDLVSKIEFI